MHIALPSTEKEEEKKEKWDKNAADPDPPPALRPAFPSVNSRLEPEQNRPTLPEGGSYM